jgi:hypothetical protein
MTDLRKLEQKWSPLVNEHSRCSFSIVSEFTSVRHERNLADEIGNYRY